MTLKTRRLIYIFFILIFLMAAPILIIYAVGYRYNFKKNEFQKTGSLFVESQPKNITIIIENEPYQDKTPVKISNLLPGEYLIKLEKDGYYPWQKKLSINPEMVTFAKNIVLFKKDILPTRLIEKQIISSLSAKDNQKIASVILNDQQQELWLINLNNQTNKVLALDYGENKEYELISWAPSSKKLLVKEKTKQQSDYLVVNIEKEDEIISLSDIPSLPYSSKEFQRIKWDLENDNYLYLQTATGIYQVNLATQETELLKLKINTDFLALNNAIYYPKKYYLMKYRDEEAEEVIKLPNSKDYTFLTSQNNLIVLNQPDSQNTLMIELNNQEIILEVKAKAISWTENKEILLYYNDLEIWLYYLTEKEKELVTRYSQPIKKTIWYPTFNYLVFIQQTDNNQDKLVIIELDSRDYRNTIELIQAENVNNLTLDNQGENLFFTAKIGNQEGLYSLNIH